MTQLTVDAILFDLDGTLVDSTASVLRNWARIAALLGRDGEDLVGDLQGIPGSQVLRIIEPDLPDERVHELNRILIDGEVDDTVGVVPTKGAAELLDALPRHRWGVVTSSPLRLAVARLAAAELPIPATLVSADDVATGKPDPAPFRLAARRMGYAATRCLAVEDAPAGITAATRAGCHTLGVLTTYPRLDGDTVPNLSTVDVKTTPRGLSVSYSPLPAG